MKKALLLLTLLTLPLFAQDAPKPDAPKPPEPLKSNVKLLTGLTPVEMQRTMNFMRASLGVTCDFCHVVSADGKWDFASDAKRDKQEAREMIAMTIDLNKTNFNGRNVVSCNTCHRGAVHPVGMPTLPQTPPKPQEVVERPKPPELKDVVAKYTAALGDVAKLESVRAKGVRVGWDNKETPIDVTLAGHTMHVHGTTPQGNVVDQYVTSDATWVRDDKGARLLPPRDEQNARLLSEAYELVLPKDIPADARVFRQDKIDDKPVWVVDAALRPNFRERLYFDVATGLLVRRTILMHTPIAEVPTQVDYSDYRDVNGVKVPFTIRMSSVDPWISATRRYESVTVGAKLDEKEFVKPD